MIEPENVSICGVKSLLSMGHEDLLKGLIFVCLAAAYTLVVALLGWSQV